MNNQGGILRKNLEEGEDKGTEGRKTVVCLRGKPKRVF